jgi:hypothetical protein
LIPAGHNIVSFPFGIIFDLELELQHYLFEKDNVQWLAAGRSFPNAGGIAGKALRASMACTVKRTATGKNQLIEMLAIFFFLF